MKNKSKILFLFAHGAGAGKDSEFMVAMANLLQSLSIEVERFDFPYMKLMTEQGRRRPPDRMPKLLDSFQQHLNHILTNPNYQNHSIFIGGKSMGGRVASLLGETLKTQPQIKGIICLGFPFHPPKSPQNFRGEHLLDIAVPTLILQGERDTFGNKYELQSYKFSPNVTIEIIPDGDHSFKPRKSSGISLQDNLLKSSQLIAQFILSHSG